MLEEALAWQWELAALGGETRTKLAPGRGKQPPVPPGGSGLGQQCPEADADAGGMSLSREQRLCQVEACQRWLSAASLGSWRCPVVCLSRRSHAVSFLRTDPTAGGKSRAR